MHAVGTFDVNLTPQAPTDQSSDKSIGRMSMQKRFSGVLEATSTGEMLASMSNVQGSAGYVAMEKVEGTLDGRPGTFVLQHAGTMNRGKPTLTVTVVPDSGTDQLAGLSGSMKIDVIEGQHHYEFAYKLDETH